MGIAPAVARKDRRADAADRIDLLNLLRLLEVGHQKIALRIDVGRGMVGDLSGVMADAESVVEHGRAEPDRQAIIASVERLPEANVMASPRAFAVALLEGQILLAVLVEQGTDRRVQVR